MTTCCQFGYSNGGAVLRCHVASSKHSRGRSGMQLLGVGSTGQHACQYNVDKQQIQLAHAAIRRARVTSKLAFKLIRGWLPGTRTHCSHRFSTIRRMICTNSSQVI